MLPGIRRSDEHCPQVEQMRHGKIPDLFEIPAPIGGRPFSWLTAVALAVLVGASLALMVKDDALRTDPQVTVVR